VRNCFLKIDTTNSGKITLGDLKQVLQSNLEVEDDHVQHIFDALDTSNTEEINYTEFLAAMVSTRINMHDELLAKTFARFDVDNTGFISKENLQVVLGDTFHGKDIDELIASADKEKTGKISYQDFMHYLKNQHQEEGIDNVADQLIDAQIKKETTADGTLPAVEEGFAPTYMRCTTKVLRQSQEEQVRTQVAEEAAATGSPPPAEKSQCCAIS